MSTIMWWCLGIAGAIWVFTLLLPPVMQAYRDAIDKRDERREAGK